MTDSNIQPPDPNQIPGTDVTNTTPAGLYPEGTVPPTDGTYNIPPETDPNYITTGTAADTFTVDPNIDYAGAVDFQVDTMNHGGPIDDPRIDHILEHLHNLEAKIDQIACDCNHHKEPPVYEGHVVLHATQQPPV